MDRNSSRTRRLTAATGYAVVVAFGITTLVALIRVKFDPLVAFDEGVILDATTWTHAHQGWRQALVLWQALSQPLAAYLVVAVPACVWAWWRRGLTTRAWWAFVTMMVGWMLALALKSYVRRARPVVDEPFGNWQGFSFPSGHATNAAIVATTLVLLLWPLLGVRGRRLAVAAGLGWVVVTGADRVLLGAHYPTDVLGGILLGGGLVLASYAGYLGWTPPVPRLTQANPPDVHDDGRTRPSERS